MSEQEAQYGKTIRGVYEKYKNLHHLLSDKEWMGNSNLKQILRDLWLAVEKEASNPTQPIPFQRQELVTPKLKEIFPKLLEQREQEGISKYHRSLETFNGRSAWQDLAEELIDALQYGLQLEMERKELANSFIDAMGLINDLIVRVSQPPIWIMDKRKELLGLFNRITDPVFPYRTTRTPKISVSNQNMTQSIPEEQTPHNPSSSEPEWKDIFEYQIFTKIQKKSNEAQKNYGAFASAHEAYGVLKEELDELWEEIKKKPIERDRSRIEKEAIDLAASAYRFAREVHEKGVNYR